MVKRLGLALGFTLIEMAIVLVVIGLLVSGGLLAIAPVIESSKVADTNQKLDRIEQALVIYAIRNMCLPCPAVPGAAVATVSTVGQATTTANSYTTGCATATCSPNTQGVVPWVNLGLSEGDITDGFGMRIDYAVDATLTVANAMNRVPPVSYPAGGLIVDGANGTALGNEITGGSGNRAAYVLISHGPNLTCGYRASTGVTPPSCSVAAGATALELANSDGSPFVQTDFNDDTTGGAYFDDIVRWRSAPIVVQLCGANACGNPP